MLMSAGRAHLLVSPAVGTQSEVIDVPVLQAMFLTGMAKLAEVHVYQIIKL